MKKKFLKFILLIFVLTLNLVCVKAYSLNYKCNATLDDNFSLDSIIVVLNNEESKKNKTYDKSDFSEINCINVVDLTYNSKILLDKQIAARESGDYSSLSKYYENGMIIDENSFQRILKLQLPHKNIDNVSEEYKIKSEILTYVEMLSNRNDVLYASVDYFVEFANESESVSVSDPIHITENIWIFDSYGITDAWNYSTGSSNVKVGIIDSGIDGTHEDLQDNIDYELSISFSNVYDDPLEDEHGHGTYVAGIVGASGDNGIGISGVCQNVSLVSLKVCADELDEDQSIQASTTNIANAVDYATANNIPILNCSVNPKGSNGNSIDDPILEFAINNYPGLFVVSAGNDSRDIDVDPLYPASYDANNIICVGAEIGHSQINASSNYGKNSVDLFAPGTINYTTDNQGGYASFGATSCAAPFVAGLAALLKSYNSIFTASDLKNIILATVDKNSLFEDKCVSGGTMNAKAALMNCSTYHNHLSSQITYMKFNSTYHKKVCLCGYIKTEPHAVLINSDTCVLCGAVVDKGFIGFNNSLRTITSNGSYIRSDGIIVLHIKDLEKYLNDELVFDSTNILGGNYEK